MISLVKVTDDVAFFVIDVRSIDSEDAQGTGIEDDVRQPVYHLVDPLSLVDYISVANSSFEVLEPYLA